MAKAQKIVGMVVTITDPNHVVTGVDYKGVNFKKVKGGKHKEFWFIPKT